MTREEAIGHIKDVICENNTIKPNIVVFEQEKEALYMAIKALAQEPFINKPCVSSEVCEHDKNKSLDKIRGYVNHIKNTGMGKKKSLEFIEKFIDGLKAESEE